MCYSVVSVPALQQFSPGGLHWVGLSWEEAQQLVLRGVEKHMIGERPTDCWWCKQVKVQVRPRFSKRMRYRNVCVKS